MTWKDLLLVVLIIAAAGAVDTVLYRFDRIAPALESCPHTAPTTKTEP